MLQGFWVTQKQLASDEIHMGKVDGFEVFTPPFRTFALSPLFQFAGTNYMTFYHLIKRSI